MSYLSTPSVLTIVRRNSSLPYISPCTSEFADYPPFNAIYLLVMICVYLFLFLCFLLQLFSKVYFITHGLLTSTFHFFLGIKVASNVSLRSMIQNLRVVIAKMGLTYILFLCLSLRCVSCLDTQERHEE